MPISTLAAIDPLPKPNQYKTNTDRRSIAMLNSKSPRRSG
jgi:hypothetical protein